MPENDMIGARPDSPAREPATPQPSAGRGEPDAHGQAALLLAESILHTLIETKVLTHAQAASAIQSACEIKQEIAEETREPASTMQRSLALLGGIERSLAIDSADSGAVG